MKDLPCIRMALCYGEEADVGLGDPSPGGLRMTVRGMALRTGAPARHRNDRSGTFCPEGYEW